ncbi:MAG: 6-phosphofructokinase [Armatimonadetes bacterium]|nr:6-phosphofructokinase [Armatimonadota bacterium]
MARGENCLIAVAGAPTAVTNCAIAGIIDEIGAGSEIADVYGAISGLAGFLDGKAVDLGAQKRKVIEGLRRTPGSILSGRYRFFGESDGEALIAALRGKDIGTLFLLGGLPALELAKFAVEAAKTANYELVVLCLPLSAENEVGAGDHTPGYGSAARFAAIATRDASRGAQGGEEPIVVLEFGGAGCGWLAASSVLARDAQNPAPHSILLPEREVNVEELVEEARRAYQKYGYAVIVTTDGAKDAAGEALDCATLTDLLSDKLNLPARYDKLGLSASVSGANVARADSDEAYGLGGLVVRLAEDGTSGYAVALGREGEGKGEKGYKVVESTLRFEQIEEYPRAVPAHFLTENGTGVSEAFVEWAKPLIGGALPEYTSLA